MHGVLAIHTKSGSFVPEWVAFCRERGVPFTEVDCFASDIVDQLRGCTALLWQWEHHDYRAVLFARQLARCAEGMGLVVFPSGATAWHYDDKVGQKYLLESVGAPHVPSYVFYDKERALRWVANAEFPLVWKLRNGAGSQNVKLISTRKMARSIVKRSFGRGWANARFHALRNRLWHLRRDRNMTSLWNVTRGIARALIPHEKNARAAVQRDYVYFQEFAPGNDLDVRVVVIGNRAFALRRFVRSHDFRASGSGAIDFDQASIPLDCVRTAFEVTRVLQAQSCAFDFVRYGEGWGIIEISYTFTADVYRGCPGYWDDALEWHALPVAPGRFIIEDVLHALDDCAA